MSDILNAFTNFLNTTPTEEIARIILLYFGWFPIFSVVLWGFIQIWLDIKQEEYDKKHEWDLLAITIPANTIQSAKGMENFFTNLAGSKSAITWKEKWFIGKTQPVFSFEIVSCGGRVQYYIRTIKKYRDLIEAAIYGQYPEAQIVEVEDYTSAVPSDYPSDEYNCFGSEMALKDKEIFPIKRYTQFEHLGEKELRFKDPLLPMLEMLGTMKPGEFFWIQYIINMPDEQDWKKASIKFMKKMYGIEEKKKKGFFEEAVGWIPGSFMEQLTGLASSSSDSKTDDFRMWKLTPDEIDTLKAVNEKSHEIGWGTKIRVVYIAKHELFRKGTIAAMTKGIFNQFDSGMNKLGLSDLVTPKDDYFFQEWVMPGKQKKLVSRYKGRSFSGGIPTKVLSCSELATLWHFPGPDARTPVLTSLGARMAEAPVELEFAQEDMAILPNIEKSSVDLQSEQTNKIDVAPFIPEMPRPASPIEIESQTEQQLNSQSFAKVEIQSNPQNVQDQGAPRFEIGMPAPLPPGLDISDTSLKEESAPDNLPL